jgi:hypothetical protein
MCMSEYSRSVQYSKYAPTVTIPANRTGKSGEVRHVVIFRVFRVTKWSIIRVKRVK